MFTSDIVNLNEYVKSSTLYSYVTKSTADSTYATKSHTHTGYAASSHNHAASNITSGTLPIARGGTGSTSVVRTTTASQVLTAATGYTISSVECNTWGPISFIYAVIKTTNAITAGSAKTVCTVKSTYASTYTVGCGCDSNGGTVRMRGTSVTVVPKTAVAANGSMYLYFCLIHK